MTTILRVFDMGDRQMLISVRTELPITQVPLDLPQALCDKILIDNKISYNTAYPTGLIDRIKHIFSEEQLKLSLNHRHVLAARHCARHDTPPRGLVAVDWTWSHIARRTQLVRAPPRFKLRNEFGSQFTVGQDEFDRYCITHADPTIDRLIQAVDCISKLKYSSSDLNLATKDPFYLYYSLELNHESGTSSAKLTDDEFNTLLEQVPIWDPLACVAYTVRWMISRNYTFISLPDLDNQMQQWNIIRETRWSANILDEFVHYTNHRILGRGPCAKHLFLLHALRAEELIADLPVQRGAINIPRMLTTSSTPTPAIAAKCKLATDIEARARDAKLNQAQTQALINVFKFQYSIIIGAPGTGKTYLSKIIDEFAIEQKETVAHLAPTGKAACVVEGVQTIHYYLQVGREIDDDIITLAIIDEMSMVDTCLFARVLEAIDPGSRVILIGDVHQIAPVQFGDLFRELTRVWPCTTLIEPMRNDDAKFLELLHRINTEQVTRAMLEEYFEVKEFTKANIVQFYKRNAKDSNTHVLAYTNETVDFVNRWLRSHAPPDKLLCVKNIYIDGKLTIPNGRIIHATYQERVIGGKKITRITYTDGKNEGETVVADGHYLLQPGHAITMHKSQGSGYLNICIVLNQSIPRRLLYTAVSRLISRGEQRGYLEFQVTGDINIIDSIHAVSYYPYLVRGISPQVTDSIQQRLLKLIGDSGIFIKCCLTTAIQEGRQIDNKKYELFCKYAKPEFIKPFRKLVAEWQSRIE